MKKKSYAATLTAIPGVGEKTSAALLAHFKTVTAVKAASISDLEEVQGLVTEQLRITLSIDL